MTTVYNPVSIGITLSQREEVFGATWAQTGHASALMNALKREPLEDRDYECIPGKSESLFSVYSLASIDPLALLYQAGYLTIKDYNVIRRTYTLGIPNEEVRQDLNSMLVRVSMNAAGDNFRDEVADALLSGRHEEFMAHLKRFFAHLTYGPRETRVYEANYLRLLRTLLSASRLYVIAEDQQASGRADLVAYLGTDFFIFELKADGSTAQEALEQILAKNYAAPYLQPGKKVTAIGLSFDPATHRLSDAICQQLA